MKDKKRHIKSVLDKFGQASVLEDCQIVLKASKNQNEEGLFNKLPYLGILYVGIEDRKAMQSLLHSFEECSIKEYNLLKIKVIEVKEDTFTVTHYDDHHHEVCLRKALTKDYIVDGNIIRSC